MHDAKISFITNVGENNLEYLKLLLKSLQTNLRYTNHEVIVFVDRDNEGTVDYLKSQKQEFNDLKIVTHNMQTHYIGYQLNINILVNLAKNDIISYLQSDMIVSKDYDVAILNELEDNCILCATRIEPPLHPPSDKTFTMDFGITPDTFKWDEFMTYAETVKSDKIQNYFFAPFTFHKKTWQSVGGHDSIFRRSREDSDILQKFLHGGVKIKQTYKANVYHFSCVSSRGNGWFDKHNIDAQEKVNLQNRADSFEIMKFIRKWGNMNHGESILDKYDVDLCIKNSRNISTNFICEVEPFFSRVWLDDEEQREHIVNYLHNAEETIANKLCHIDDADWDVSKKYYNTTDHFSIYCSGSPRDYRCMITIDSNNLNAAALIAVIKSINLILENYESGTYETDGIKIEIGERVKSSDAHLITVNPQFDYSLLNIQ